MAADVEFIRKHSSGYICVGMEGSTLDRLQLPLMVRQHCLMVVLSMLQASTDKSMLCLEVSTQC